MTLHALGYKIIQQASKRGYIAPEYLDLQSNVDFLPEILSRKAIQQLAMKYGAKKEDLNVDEEDLRNQIAAWKGNLYYPTIGKVKLPKKAKKQIQEAEHPNEWYVPIFEIYEQQRRRNKWLTFDDMLLTAWELLVKHDDILQETKAKFESVLVDEFQDVNKVQYLIMDLITESHRNYMAIGDDDQCIYEWRGASPNYILTFEETYEATVFHINDNFRSTAHQLLLANEVIQHNQNRYPKTLSLTKGFEGNTFVLKAQQPLQEAQLLVDEIKHQLSEGKPVGNMAILIRLYAQTPIIETELIRRGIKYHVTGNLPFYRRQEVVCLLKYLRFAIVDKSILDGKGYPKKLTERKRYLDDFKTILYNPNKFVSQTITEEICRRSSRNHTSVLEEVLQYSGKMHPRVRQRLDTFLEAMEFLMDRLDDPADRVLNWLCLRMDYREHLMKINGYSELGEFKWKTVRSFIAFAKDQGKPADLLQRIYGLAQGYKNFEKEPEENWLKILTVFRAKGLEWDTVFMPGCNQGIFPYLRDEEAGLEILEAERRLFYVGLTRAKRTLYLSYWDSDPISQFLLEVDSQKIIEDAYEIRDLLRLSSKEDLSPDDNQRLETKIGIYPLGKYFHNWFTGRFKLKAKKK